MKKKVLFMMINMNVGGTEKSLLNLLDILPKDQYDITILLLEKSGGFLRNIPSHVEVKVLEQYKEVKKEIQQPPLRVVLDHTKTGNIGRAFTIFSLHALSKLTKERTHFYKFMLKDSHEDRNRYDIAIAYAGPMEFISYYIAKKVKAEKKIQWIHFDVNSIGFNPIFARKIYKAFDKVLVASNEGKRKLLKKQPALMGKTDVFLNHISPVILQRDAVKGPGFIDDFNGIRILTVGRLAYEKGQDLAIKALSKLKGDGLQVRWYCIGNGGARNEYTQLVKTLNIERDFIFLGEKTNPYPYMKRCDIYVQPSRHEGYCITLAEAKVFQRPIVATQFTGAAEQITDSRIGIIVPINENAIYLAVKELINQSGIRREFSNEGQYDAKL